MLRDCTSSSLPYTPPNQASDFRSSTHPLLHEHPRACCTPSKNRPLHPQPVNFSTFRPYFPVAAQQQPQPCTPVDVAASCDAAAAKETVTEMSAGAALQPNVVCSLSNCDAPSPCSAAAWRLWQYDFAWPRGPMRGMDVVSAAAVLRSVRRKSRESALPLHSNSVFIQS